MSAYDRRRVIAGVASLGLAGTAVAMEPRRRAVDFSHGALGDLIPLDVAGWRGAEDANVVPERVDGSIDRGRTLTRIYMAEMLRPVMMVASYHGPDSPELKVHRPETCYLVAGFTGGQPVSAVVRLSPSQAIPSVTFTATRETRKETVLYWTRVGERFPQTLDQQRIDFISQALAGVRSDGLLLRLSTVGPDPVASMHSLEQFAKSMITAASPAGRKLLLGGEGALATLSSHTTT